MYCQLKYVKYKYLNIFKDLSKKDISILIILSIIIYTIGVKTIRTETLDLIIGILSIIIFIIFYIQGIIYCKNNK